MEISSIELFLLFQSGIYIGVILGVYIALSDVNLATII